MVYWLSLDVVEQRTEACKEKARRNKRPEERENGQTGSGRKEQREKKEETELVTIDCGVGLFMGVPMRTICSKELVVLNVYSYPVVQASCYRKIDDSICPYFHSFYLLSQKPHWLSLFPFLSIANPKGIYQLIFKVSLAKHHYRLWLEAFSRWDRDVQLECHNYHWIWPTCIKQTVYCLRCRDTRNSWKKSSKYFGNI